MRTARPPLSALALISWCVPLPGCNSPSDGTVDTGTPTECGQTHPRVIEAAEDIAKGVRDGVVLYPTLMLVDGTLFHYATRFDPDPCMPVTVDGQTTTITGLCTTSYGVEVSGTVMFVELENPTSTGWPHTSTYDHLHFLDTFYSHLGYDVDGTWEYNLDELGASYALDLFVAFLDGVAEDHSSGTFRGNGVYSEGGFTESGYADVVSENPDDPVGDFCYALDWTFSDSCDSEGDGTATITGTQTGTLTWDGSTSCDGCANATVNGRPAGRYCD